MSSRRPLILMAVLLVLVLSYVWSTQRPHMTPYASAPAVEPPLAGENSLSKLVVAQNDSGLWEASFDYFYTGAPAHSHILIDFGSDAPARSTGRVSIKRGAHQETVPIGYPGDRMTTRQIRVQMVDPIKQIGDKRVVVADASIDHTIDWPDFSTWHETLEFAKRSSTENLERAIELIDSGSRDKIVDAKLILERLVNREPSFEQAYIELARVAMKTNWGPEGLHHAEALITSALEINPTSTNAKILMGYVYAHQRKFRKAEKLFVESAANDNGNVWLWANWGELLLMQGKFDAAETKYREAIARIPSNDSYNRARLDAFQRLLVLIERKGDLDGMDALYKQRMSEHTSPCARTEYARFLLRKRNDPLAAADLAEKALSAACESTDAREILGLANYVLWSQAQGSERVQILSRARIYLPPGPKTLYLLASEDKTSKVATQLVRSGESIEQKDNDGFNALALAIQNHDLQGAQRLLKLGAKVDTRVGYGEVPVALMPVMDRDLEMIKLLQNFGANYASISYEGMTAFDVAKQTGDDELLAVLRSRSQVL